MKLIFVVLLLVLSTAPVFSQKTLVIYDPTAEVSDYVPELSKAEAAAYKADVLPKIKARYSGEGCAVDPELAGSAIGSFTRRGAVQKAAFYQVCQTGNGLGIVAIVIFERGKVVGVWGDNSGWTLSIGRVADLNSNGIDEFTLSFGGGMHQGEGGIGVDVMEFSGGRLQNLGWFLAEKIMDTETDSAWKVSVRTGKTPVFYRQKYKADKRGKLIRSGANAAFKLTKVDNGFEAIK